MTRTFLKKLIAMLVLCMLTLGSAAAATLDIPQGHPRLWYSTNANSPGLARLQRARAYSATHPVPITGWQVSQNQRDRALRSVMRGQTPPFNPGNDPDCANAASWLRTFQLTDTHTVGSDEARWDGENAILVYDWCNYALSDADRTTLVNRWNGYTTTLNAAPWGGLSMAANNYFHGYLRNCLLWAVTSYHDGGPAQRQTAQGFLDHCLDVRYRSLANPPMPNGSKFKGWYEAFGIGGATAEGTQYGIYMLGYPVTAFSTIADYGYDAWNAVPFWRDAVYYLQYGATPAKTRRHDNGELRWEMFPFSDDQFFVGGGSAEDQGYADFLGAMILSDPAAPLARLAKTWLDTRTATPSWWIGAELASATITATSPLKPLDYYAAGSQFFYGRSANSANAMTFMQELGGFNAYTSNVNELEADGGVGHSHQGLGNFQLWRNGRWITRETTGYNIFADGVKGWNNGPVVDPLEAVAHNTALFQGRGQIYTRRDWATVLRLQTSPGFAYSAVDMTESYRAPAHETWLAEDDWPFAEVAIREFVYLRELEAMVILDRMKSGSDSLNPVYDGSYTGPQMAGHLVKKSFVLHATGTGTNENGNPFVLSPGRAVATIGNQRMDLHTLLPATPAYRVIDEGGDVGQFRLEYDVSGTEMSYLLNVVSARDDGQVPVTAVLEEIGNLWQLTVTHPQKGSATVVFQKGETSTGGSVRIGQNPALPLRANMQSIVITNIGPVWEGDLYRIRMIGGRTPVAVPIEKPPLTPWPRPGHPSHGTTPPPGARTLGGRTSHSGKKQ